LCAIACALIARPLGARLADEDPIAILLLEREVGAERTAITEAADGVTLESSVDFVDRGGRVQLDASLVLAPDLTPRHFRAKGRAYRFVNVDVEVTAAGGRLRVSSMGDASEIPAPSRFFTARTWAPVAARALLVRYWERHGRPSEIALVPGDSTSSIRITLRGDDRVAVDGRTGVLRRYSVDGVVWGREALWLDERGGFAALVSRVHILPLEAVRRDLRGALPQLQESAVADRMADLRAMGTTVPPIASGAFALVGARIVGGEGPPLDDAVVVVRDGRIAAVGPRASTPTPRDARRIDVGGRTIVPGLWDLHAHASQIEWAPAYLAAGVTTIRDMGGEARFLTAFRDALASGRTPGPRLLLAGLVDGPGDRGFGTTVASTPDEARAIVDRYRAAGFQQMKLYSLLQPLVVHAIAERAHGAGMTVTGHVPSALGLEGAVASGMDQIAHQPVRGRPGTPDTDRMLGRLAERRTVIDPTQAWSELLGREPGVRIESFEPGIRLAPYALAANYRSVLNAPREQSEAPGTTSIIRAMADRGIPIVAGTDGALAGHSLHRELELYVRAGLSPAEALRAATRDAAGAMGLEGEGGIAPGRRADLLVLDRDPLADISAIRTGRYVVAGGRVYECAALWRLAGFVER
jgi:imidazolonepropionase-like amidohydrolase